MAIALNGGHVARAIDFFETAGKYFIIGGTSPWADESKPDTLDINTFKMKDVVGLKKVDDIQFVVPDDDGSIIYRTQNWRKVAKEIITSVGVSGVPANSYEVPVVSTGGLVEKKSKVRINNVYEGTVLKISGGVLTLDTPAPVDIPASSPVLGGAIVEGAKYVYLECYLNYDQFPVVTYRQIGLCTGVKVADTAKNDNILLSKGIEGRLSDDYSSLGILEILDNRVPSTRDINQREQLSLIIEF